MQAYLNDPKLKKEFIKELLWHKKQDAFVQGIYDNGEENEFKGCAVGCSINSLNRIQGTAIETNDHAAYETKLGIPRAIAMMEDRIFEGLSTKDAKAWPLRFARAINPGADLSLVTPKLMLWILSDGKCGVLQYAKTERSKKAIQTVIDLYIRELAGEVILEEEWLVAAHDAAHAANVATYVAAHAADVAARAIAATYAVGYAAEAYANYAAFGYAAASQKRFKDIADHLIELLKEAR